MIGTHPLGSVVDVSAGQPAPKPNEFAEEGKPFIRAGSLENLLNDGSLSDCERIPERIAERKRLRLYPKDTIVFAKSGMSATLGRVYRLSEPAYVVSHLVALAPTGRYDPTFLTYWLRKNPPSHLIKDPSYPSIRVGEIEDVQVPDLSLKEQNRVAAILDKADGIRRKREKTRELVGDLLRSAFLEMFGDPVSNPRNWPLKKLGEVLERIDSGKSPRCEPRPAGPGEMGILKVSAISSTEFLPEENKAVVEGHQIDPRHLVRKGDLLFSRKNTYGLVGATVIAKGDCENLAMPDLIFRLVPRESFVLTAYLWGALSQASMRQSLRSLAGGAAASMPNIGKGRLTELPIPIPPLQCQTKFQSFYFNAEKIKMKCAAQGMDADALFEALAQRAFRGEL